ncbi:ABC transporter ATP-binding protein [Marinospirillum perlucidum]|uniref:ABC transporter ATP-binding protein n=1 Tax=Marinospirillum perlucidum TaxID=1982602 RepID=UPI000DF2B320|nr:ABC transporter ATP-binding protein [Marinospirillum perlucidum]
MLRLENIEVIRQERSILRVPQLEVAEDQVTVILGHNGSGKSTLMKLLARQLQPDRGEVFLEQKPIARFSQRSLAQKLAFLPQQLPEVGGLTVKDLVLLGRYPWRGLLGRWQASDFARVDEAMQATDVLKYRDQSTDLLSGGERQRAWIAMLLAQEAPLLLLDEPTSALDLSHQYELMQLLSRLNRDTGRGLVIILHDINLACRYADRVLALKQGELAFDGRPDQLLDESHLSGLYELDIRLCPHPLNKQPVAVVA